MNRLFLILKDPLSHPIITLEKDLENLKQKCSLPRQMQARRIIGLKNWLEYTPFFNG